MTVTVSGVSLFGTVIASTSLIVLLVLSVLALLLNSGEFGVPGLLPLAGRGINRAGGLVDVPTAPVLELVAPSTPSMSLLRRLRSPVLPLLAVLHLLSLISASGFVITLLLLLDLE